MTPLSLARTVAVDAGRFLKRHQPGRRRISYKGGVGNLVTDMDRASEARIVGALRRAYPDHAIVAEEGGGRSSASACRWFVDPVDGTTNYAHGFPFYCVSIALEVHGVMELGVIYGPSLDELFVGVRGKGAFRNGRRIRASRASRLDRSLLCTGFPYEMKYKVENLEYWRAFTTSAQGIRRMGSAALDLCYTACGIYDGFWEYHLGPWDVAAGALICQEAGARVTDWNEGPVDLFKGEVLAAGPALHKPMLNVIRKVRRNA